MFSIINIYIIYLDRATKRNKVLLLTIYIMLGKTYKETKFSILPTKEIKLTLKQNKRYGWKSRVKPNEQVCVCVPVQSRREVLAV